MKSVNIKLFISVAAFVSAAVISGCGSSSSSTTPGSPAVFYSTAAFHGYSSPFSTYSTVRMSGYNGFGQMGDATTTSRTGFSRVSLPNTVKGVAVGGYHAIAFNTYTAWSAGGNASGQLGRTLSNGKTQDEVFSTVTDLPSGKKIDSAAAGGAFSLLLIGGEVHSFGLNDKGQLGNGGYVDNSKPAAVTDASIYPGTLSSMIEISAGAAHGLARNAAGQIYGWGYNGYGQLGDNTFFNRPSAYQLNAFANNTSARAIAAGNSFSAAIDTKDRLYLWGNNGSGQIAKDPNVTLGFASPQIVDGIDNVRKVSAGVGHVIALKKDGTVWSWGYNAFGQAGNGTKTDFYTPTEVKINGLSMNASDVKTFGNSSFALVNGIWYGWGDNARGQLGVDTGTLPYTLTPVQVPMN